MLQMTLNRNIPTLLHKLVDKIRCDVVRITFINANAISYKYVIVWSFLGLKKEAQKRIKRTNNSDTHDLTF